MSTYSEVKCACGEVQYHFEDKPIKTAFCYCKDCGTNLYIEVRVANIISIATGTLINSTELKPNIVIYTSSAPSWAVFPEGVPRFEKLPPQ